MAGKPGRSALIEQLLADDMTYMFGNPGTVEQGFLDALHDHPAMRYILALQESVAVMMADGYARARRRPALVQIHSTPGLGNAVGALYQAMRGHAPLVVIGGDAGLRYMPMQAQMYGDLVAMAEPVTKWSAVVTDARSLLRMVRRAVKIAAMPPMGPVYLCLPADVLDQECPEIVEPSFVTPARVAPEETVLREAARMLGGAERPMLFVGDGVAYSEAQSEALRVAELLGAEIWGVDSGELNVPYDHPLYQGQTGHMFGFASHPVTSKGDVNLVVGTYMMPEVYPRLEDIYAPGAKVIHVDLDPTAIARNHRVTLGAVADPKLTLARLAELLEGGMDGSQKKAASVRADKIGREKAKLVAGQKRADQSKHGASPLSAARFMEELARELSPGAVIFDEALSCSPELTRYLPPRAAGSFFQTRGGSLGVGFPGAIGVKLAMPAQTVVGFSGDGGCMYTVQALWTAARYGIDVKFVVCNNQSYKLLKVNIQRYWKEQGVKGSRFPDAFELGDPLIDFASLAASLGVAGVKVERPDQTGPALRRMLQTPGPFLIDLVVSSHVPGELTECRCGQ
jgi:thiamine pyrophosphate-dependent acetolactate synthase large subunit-like protein